MALLGGVGRKSFHANHRATVGRISGSKITSTTACEQL